MITARKGKLPWKDLLFYPFLKYISLELNDELKPHRSQVRGFRCGKKVVSDMTECAVVLYELLS